MLRVTQMAEPRTIPATALRPSRRDARAELSRELVGPERQCLVDAPHAHAEAREAAALDVRVDRGRDLLAVDLDEEEEIGSVWISEIEWPETQEFTIEVKQGEAWREIARGTTIGADKTIEFAPVRAREVRLHVLKAKRPININEFQLFTK